MPSIIIPVHSYRLNSRTASNSRLVNCFAEAVPQGKQPVRLTRAPGIVTHATPGVGAGRGLAVLNESLYAVIGTGLYTVSAGGTEDYLGEIVGTGPCSMAANSYQLAIGTDGGTWYVYDSSLAVSPLAQITDPDFRGARRAGFVDNFIVYVEPVSGRFFCSDLADAIVYDSLDFATAEGAPDNLVTLIVDHREVILLGSASGEIWYNASNGAGFPFERSPGGFLELGALAVAGVTKADNSVFWLASDKTIRRLNGTTPTRVSHHGVEEKIAGYATVSDCEAYAYTWNGHICAVFRFPTAGATWVFDITTGEWHERQTYYYADWRVSGFAECYGKTWVQDSVTGAIGYLSNDTCTEFGGIQRAEWTYQNVYRERKRQFHTSLEIVADVGVGLLYGQGSDPRLTLELSNDGGVTWTALPTETLGAQGEYGTRVIWNRLGMSPDRVYRCSISDPVPLSVHDTVLELT